MEEEVLYDFSLVPGDSISLIFHNAILPSPPQPDSLLFYVVDSISLKNSVDNSHYPSLLLRGITASDTIYLIWVESIGALHHFDYKNTLPYMSGNNYAIFINPSDSLPAFGFDMHQKCKFVNGVATFNTDSILLSERSYEACDYHQSISLAIKDEDTRILLKIFPNPTSSILAIETELTNAQYQVFDIYGRLVSTGKIDNNQINVSTLVSGIYLLQVDSGEKLYSARFLKE